MASRAAGGRRRLRARVRARLTAAAALLVAVLSPLPARAGAGQGLSLAKRHECAAAVPLLEAAESEKHAPFTAYVLAGCYVELGALIKASDLYHAIAGEKLERGWTLKDAWARGQSKEKAALVDARIPTIAFAPAVPLDDFEVELDGRTLGDPAKPERMAPDVSTTVVARAKGRKERRQNFTLQEGERKVVTISLEPLPLVTVAPIVEAPVAQSPEPPRPRTWVGARFQAFIIPTFMWHFFGDGGRSVFLPGGGVTLTVPRKSTDIVMFLGYASYHVGDTPFKPIGAPRTDYEIIDSTLQALYATVSLMWTFPLDEKQTWAFRAGGGLGVGWMFAGDLQRTQAYPRPGDTNPYDYIKCKGPDNPSGTFLYCNQLNRDAAHYHNYPEPDWFHHGVRPLVYPLVMLPELALSYRPSRSVVVDLEAGLSVSGILASLGVRYGL